jgi:hypothetical protein
MSGPASSCAFFVLSNFKYLSKAKESFGPLVTISEAVAVANENIPLPWLVIAEKGRRTWVSLPSDVLSGLGLVSPSGIFPAELSTSRFSSGYS